MLSFTEKISYLESCLLQNEDNFADSFKTDIMIVLGDFEVQNSNLKFLENLSSREEISLWLNNLTSRIVLKFDDESEQLSDFIYDYLKLG